MAQWKPRSDEPIGKNEHVGRRLFDEPMLMGAKNQRPFAGFELRHFQETRDQEFSLDRLGRSGIDKKIVRYLRPRADLDAGKFKTPRKFNGWVVLRVQHLLSPPSGTPMEIVASPIVGNGLEENLYHAHIILAPDDNYSVALHLRHLFTTYGSFEAAVDGAPPEAVGRRIGSAIGKIKKLLMNLVRPKLF